jgi:hypothetical protein
MRSKKVGTVALIVQCDGNAHPMLLEKFSDDREIEVFEQALGVSGGKPLEAVYELRVKQAKEDEDFGNYIEELLSQPFLRPEIQEHGLQWLKSKIKIEEFRKAELQAAQTIADFAFKLFLENPKQTDFFLAGGSAKVRIRVFVLESARAGIDSGQAA